MSCRGLIVSLLALASFEAQGRDYGWKAEAGVHPEEATPRWRREGDKGSDVLKENALIFDTPSKIPGTGSGAISRIYVIKSRAHWNPESKGATIRFRLKVDELAYDVKYAANIGFTTGSRSFRFSFTPSEVAVNSGETALVDAHEWQTYYLVYQPGNAAELYLEGEAAPLLTTDGVEAISEPYLYFGAIFAYTGGKARWEEVSVFNGVRPPSALEGSE